MANFDEKNEEITAICLRYGIKRLFVFGSALRDDFRPGESDIDLLVEFGPLEVTKLFLLKSQLGLPRRPRGDCLFNQSPKRLIESRNIFLRLFYSKIRGKITMELE